MEPPEPPLPAAQVPPEAPPLPWGEYGAPIPAPAPAPAPPLPGATAGDASDPAPSGAPAAVMAGTGDPLRGVLAGFIAAVLGALAWALVVGVTHYELGILAVVVGYGVGWAVHRFGGVASNGLAVIAAVLAAVGILLGFVLSALIQVSQAFHVGVLDVLDNIVNWPRFVGDAVNGIGWFFLVLGAYGAFRMVVQQRSGGMGRGRRRAG